ncbi:MAG: tetratricopeptide repeat protein [bacterium]
MKRLTLLTLTIIAAVVCISACSKKPAENAGVDRYNRGISLLESGDNKGAIVEFEAALRADPNFFEAEKNLAGAYVEDGKWEYARTHYSNAIAMRPDDPSLYANIAIVFMHLNEPQLAWDNVKKSREKDQYYPLAHFVAGELFIAGGDFEQAKRAFGDYLSLEQNTRFSIEAEKFIADIDSGNLSDLPSFITGSEGMTQPVLMGENQTQNPTDENLKPSDNEKTATEEAEKVDETKKEEKPAEESVKSDEEKKTETEEKPKEEKVTEEKPKEEETKPVAEEKKIEDETAKPDEAEQADEVTESTVEEEELKEPELPKLEGDALYRDRLSRGRQMRASGATAAAIRLLLEAFDVHPDYAQINNELALAYLADGQTGEGKTYLKRYIKLETDPDLRAAAEARLKAIEDSEKE